MTRALIANGIEQAFEYHLSTACAVDPGAKILIAVSGGVDSMVLLALCQKASEQLTLEIGVFHLDHQYRGDASEGDYRLVKDYCQKHMLPFFGYRRPIQSIANRLGQGFESVARDTRYRLISTIAATHRYQVVLTAHHQGDHVETVFLHMLRGSGLQGLTGIASRRGNLARPLLSLDKQALYQYAKSHGISYREDLSNTDTAFKRNHLRQELLPFLQTHYGEGVIKTIAQTASILTVDNGFIVQQTEMAAKACLSISGNILTLDLSEFEACHLAIKRRLVFKIFDAINSHHQDVAMQHVEVLIGWFDQGATSSIQLFQGIHFEKRQKQIRIMSQKSYEASLIKKNYVLKFGEQTLRDWGIRVIVELVERVEQVESDEQGSIEKAAKSSAVYEYPIYGAAAIDQMPEFWLRQRQAGDVIQLPGEAGHHRPLKKLFNDFKLASDQKASVPIIGTGETVLWVVGHFQAKVNALAGSVENQKKPHCMIRIHVFSL